MLPWQVALALVVASYFGFHHLASLPSTLIGARTPLQSLGDGMVRQFMITFSMILQYLVPLAFVLGAFMSARKRRRQSELHAQVASAPHRHALENMSWSEFEGLTAEVFRRKGYTVAERGGNGPRRRRRSGPAHGARQIPRPVQAMENHEGQRCYRARTVRCHDGRRRGRWFRRCLRRLHRRCAQLCRRPVDQVDAYGGVAVSDQGNQRRYVSRAEGREGSELP